MTIGVEIRKLMMREDLIAQEQNPLVNADFPAIAQRALAGDPHFSRLLQDMAMANTTIPLHEMTC